MGQLLPDRLAQHKILLIALMLKRVQFVIAAYWLDLGNSRRTRWTGDQANLWSALWDGGVYCASPIGQEIFRVKMPVQRPTGPTFEELILTETSPLNSRAKSKEIQQGFYAGDLFAFQQFPRNTSPSVL